MGQSRSLGISRALSTPELVELLSDPNKWTRQTALRLIGDRKDSSIAPSSMRLLTEETGQIALEALWALNLVGGLDEATGSQSPRPCRPVRAALDGSPHV